MYCYNESVIQPAKKASQYAGEEKKAWKLNYSIK